MARPNMQFSTHEQSNSDGYLLVRELTHRINNEYAAAIGLVSLAAARSENAKVKQELSRVLNSLYSYARVHRALEMPACDHAISAAHYMRDLCHSISLSKLEIHSIQLVLVEHEFQMNAEKCWRLGMIASELITNAARHAFGDQGGIIRVEFSRSESFVECRVSDNGSARSHRQPGQGLRLVDALAKSLQGSVVQQFGPWGATTLLVFPHES
jgi:two-component sensor histidine kinase